MTAAPVSLAEFLTSNPSVLIVAGTKNPLDTVPACLALATRIRQNGGNAACLAPSGIPAPLAFLGSEPILSSSAHPLKGVSMSVTPLGNPIAGLHYLREGSSIHLIFSDNHGGLIPREELRVERATPTFGAAITLGLDDAQLRTFCSAWNIDERNVFALHHERLSHIRSFVDENAGSYCEMLTRELKRTGEEAMSPTVATYLLAGLIATTNNFQNEQVKPQTLFAAAYLIAKGADKDTVIRNLYKIKPLSFLKLWGVVLGSFTYLPGSRVGYSWIERDKISDLPDGMRHIGTLITELAGATARARALIIALETTRGAWCVVRTQQEVDARTLARHFGVQATGKAFVVPLRVRTSVAEEARALALTIERILA